MAGEFSRCTPVPDGYCLYWLITGPTGMILLFVFVSIPMIEKKLLVDKPDYANYKKNTCSLFPFSYSNR